MPADRASRPPHLPVEGLFTVHARAASRVSRPDSHLPIESAHEEEDRQEVGQEEEDELCARACVGSRKIGWKLVCAEQTQRKACADGLGVKAVVATHGKQWRWPGDGGGLYDRVHNCRAVFHTEVHKAFYFLVQQKKAISGQP